MWGRSRISGRGSNPGRDLALFFLLRFLVFVFIFPLVLFACVFGEHLQMARARCNVAPAAPPDGRIKDLSSGRSSSIASIQPSSCATCSKSKEESGLVYATFHMAKMGSVPCGQTRKGREDSERGKGERTVRVFTPHELHQRRRGAGVAPQSSASEWRPHCSCEIWRNGAPVVRMREEMARDTWGGSWGKCRLTYGRSGYVRALFLSLPANVQ